MAGHRATVTFAVEELDRLSCACFEKIRVREQDAIAVAEALMLANLGGIDLHDVDRILVYMRRVNAGLAGGSERVLVLARHGALHRLDAGHAHGRAVGVKAIDLAAETARSHGVGLAALEDSTNVGAAGF